MADYQKREGQGSLFVNNKKQSDNHPDMTGSVVINGVEKRVAAWWKQPRNGGDEYLSISVSDFQQQAAPRQEPQAVDYRRQAAPNPNPQYPSQAAPQHGAYQQPQYPQQAAPQGNPFEPRQDDLPF